MFSQGVFDDQEDKGYSETGDEDYGHYSIVTYADTGKKQLIIADPYKDYINQARIFDFKEFDRRWYDYNEVRDPRTGWARIVKDDHMLFIITPRRETFPTEPGMKPRVKGK